MMMQEMMMMQRTMMQQMMQRPSTKPIGMPTFPNNVMPTFPNNVMPTFPNNVMPTFPNNMMPALGTESLNAGLFPSLGAPRANNSGQDMLANLMKYIQQSTTAAK
jgi:hypothetical protein